MAAKAEYPEVIDINNMYSFIRTSPDNRTPYQWLGALAIMAFVILGTHSSIFSLAAFALTAAQLVFGDEEYSWKLCFFLFSFSTIFKLSPNSTSLFTYLMLLFDIVLFINRRTLPPLWILFAIYMVAVPYISLEFSSFHLLKWIKLLCGLLMMLYFFDRDSIGDADELFLYFIAGVILASLTYYLDSGFFRISRYKYEVGIYYAGMSEEEANLRRFAGLYNDPNYYSVNVIISMCLAVFLLHRRKIPMPLFALIMALCFYFVKETYSKSSFLMLAIPILAFLYSNKLGKRRILQFFSIAGISLVVIYLFLTDGGSAFGVIFKRLSTSGGDLNSLTTGRLKLWIIYLNDLWPHPMVVLFGRGINAPLVNGVGTHNVYVQMLWNLGLVGSGILMGILLQIFHTAPRRAKGNYLNNCVLLSLIIMYFFLGMLFYYDPPYHLIIAFITKNLKLDEYPSVAA